MGSVRRQAGAVETIGDVMNGKTVTTKLSIKKFRTVIGKLSQDQRSLVRKHGFGTLLDIKCSRLPRNLSVCLAKWFDCDRRTVSIPNGRSFELNAFTVHQILGIPLGGLPINKAPADESREAVAVDTGIRGTGPSISHLMGLLRDDLLPDQFMRIFMLIMLQSFLCPTSSKHASPEYFNGIRVVDEISNYDWCGFTLDWLVDKIRQFQEGTAKPNVPGKAPSLSLGGCLIIPVFTFFDFLDVGQARVQNCVPRLPAWDDKAISNYDNLNLGELKIKDVSNTAFVQSRAWNSSCSRLPISVSQCIQSLFPSDEHTSARVKMERMCNEYYQSVLNSCFDAMEPVLQGKMCNMVQAFADEFNNGAGASMHEGSDGQQSQIFLFPSFLQSATYPPRHLKFTSRGATYIADNMPEGPTGHRNHPISATPFESFYDGSWHGVNSIRIRNGGLFVKFIYSGSTFDHKIAEDHLRVRSRRVTCFDCSHVLKPGVDVCVASPRPLQTSSGGETKASVLFCHDARLISIKRNHNADQCLCLFVVVPYESQIPGNTKKVISDSRAEVVTLDNVFLLQKLQPKELQEGSMEWNSAEDCLSRNRSRLFTARFSSEITYLVVLSILKGMEFNIKLVQGKIIYQIVKGDQARCSLDCVSIPPGFGKNMEIISFQLRDETLRPMIRNIPFTDAKKHNLTEDRRFTLKTELDSLLDVDGLYEHVDLRRSKRLKTQPERFTSYDTPNFCRVYKKKGANASSIKNDNSQRALHQGSPVDVESCCAEVPVNITLKQTDVGSFMVKENPSSTERQHKNRTRRTPCSLLAKEKPGSVEMKETSTTDRRGADFHIPQTPAQNKEKHHRPPLSFQRKSFSSPCSINDNSEPAFCQKRGWKRKKHMSEGEYKQMINKCIENIQSEMDRDSGFNLDAPVMNYSQDAYRQEDFTWPSSSDSQEEKDELEPLWKEMDYSLTTLVLLEQKQNSDSDTVHESTADFEKSGEIPCQHDCVLDEELGLTCRLCNVVCVEANGIFPQMFTGNDYSKERPGCRNFFHDNRVLDPSLIASSAPEFSEFRGYSGNLWSLIPDLDPKLLPHQRKAFEFIWKNLAGSFQLEKMDNSTAITGGCVVAHTPGSGKTMLLISFLVAYLKVHPRSRPLVLTPKSAIHTWRREFEKWGISLPLHVLHHSNRRGKPMGDIDSKLQAILSSFHRPAWKNMRLVDCLDKLCKWHERPSVLLMTYSSFLGLTKKDSKMQQRAFMAQVLMNNPGLLILDEGHNPRSTRSKLRKLLMKVKTEFRILLSGTVFQNNFEEYFNTLSLARPRFANDVMTVLVPEKKRETGSRRARHQEAARRVFVERVGQKMDPSNNCDRIDGINLLNKLTCGFIDSFEGAKLNNLPGIHVYTLFMKPTDIQQEILTKLTMATSHAARYPLEIELLITIGSIHPWLITTTRCATTYFTPAEVDKVGRYKAEFAVGCKAKFVIDLLHKSSFRGERVLIFCHNVSPINFLVKLIENVFGWCLGEEVLVLQGDQELAVRSNIMDKFNGDGKGKRKVLIASTTACAEGISLTGASRLVMLDSEWNHSKTRQAIARAFRPGQEKTVFVYLLVASGTWEEEKYNSNRRKAWMAKMVFLGRYVHDPLQNAVTAIDDDDVLQELADEDDNKTFHRIVKQD